MFRLSSGIFSLRSGKPMSLPCIFFGYSVFVIRKRTVRPCYQLLCVDTGLMKHPAPKISCRKCSGKLVAQSSERRARQNLGCWAPACRSKQIALHKLEGMHQLIEVRAGSTFQLDTIRGIRSPGCIQKALSSLPGCQTRTRVTQDVH